MAAFTARRFDYPFVPRTASPGPARGLRSNQFPTPPTRWPSGQGNEWESEREGLLVQTESCRPPTLTAKERVSVIRYTSNGRQCNGRRHAFDRRRTPPPRSIHPSRGVGDPQRCRCGPISFKSGRGRVEAHPRGSIRPVPTVGNHHRLGPESRSGPGRLILSSSCRVISICSLALRRTSRSIRSSPSPARSAARLAAARLRPVLATLRSARIAAAVPFRTARTTFPRRPSAAVPSRSRSSLLNPSTASSRAARPG